jgi:hypothetical protein
MCLIVWLYGLVRSSQVVVFWGLLLRDRRWLELSLSSAHLLPLQLVLTPPRGLHGGKSTDGRARAGGGVKVTRLCGGGGQSSDQS